MEEQLMCQLWASISPVDTLKTTLSSPPWSRNMCPVMTIVCQNCIINNPYSFQCHYNNSTASSNRLGHLVHSKSSSWLGGPYRPSSSFAHKKTSLQLIQCSKSLILQNAQVQLDSRAIIADTLNPSIQKNQSKWQSFPNLPGPTEAPGFSWDGYVSHQ
jgi:hypothetical protein